MAGPTVEINRVSAMHYTHLGVPCPPKNGQVAAAKIRQIASPGTLMSIASGVDEKYSGQINAIMGGKITHLG